MGDPHAADGVRHSILTALGTDLSGLVPGSPRAIELKEYLVGEGMWSAYLEVGIGPDAEIFTKAPVLSTVGTATEVGIRSDRSGTIPSPRSSSWSPRRARSWARVSATTSTSGTSRAAPRSCSGRRRTTTRRPRSARSSGCSTTRFGLERLERETVSLRVEGDDGYVLEAVSPLSEIRRTPRDLVDQTIGRRHQYPDGFVLYLGTMFAPTDDRGTPGRGFTHHLDDIVRISSPSLGGSGQSRPAFGGPARLGLRDRGADVQSRRPWNAEDTMTRITTTDPRDGTSRPLDIEETSAEEVRRLVDAAVHAANDLQSPPRSWRAGLLRAFADELEASRDDLIDAAESETGLTRARLDGEVTRTVFQFRLFADAVDEGSYLEASHRPRRRDPDRRRRRTSAECSCRSARSRCSARATSRSRSRCPAATRPRPWRREIR